MTMEIKAVIFDMDGVLIDSEPLWREAEMLIFPQYGIPMTEEMCRAMKGTKIDEVVRHWHKVYNWQPPELELVEKRIIDKLVELIQTRGVPMPGLLPVLEFLKKRGILTGVATSSLFSIMDVVIETLDLGRHFDVLHSAEAEKAGKPAPDVFLGTARRLGVKPGECLVIEDSVTGIIAAREAGMYTLALPEADEFELEKYDIANDKIRSLEDLMSFPLFQ